MISYGKQSINDQDIDAVVNVLKSDFLTQGPCLQQFEECVSQYVGAEYGLAVNSATSALHIACMALGLSKGDWVWTTPISFVATSNAAIYCDADVEFVDVDANTFNMCANVLEKKNFSIISSTIYPYLKLLFRSIWLVSLVIWKLFISYQYNIISK